MRTMLDHLGLTRTSLSERYGVGVGTIGMRLTGAGLDEPGMRAKKQPQELTLLPLVGASPEFPFALCAETDPELFFPDKGGSAKDAKRICNACEHKAECLAWALENNEQFGIYGGASERERRRLQKKGEAA
jgi:WhiB family redox-sensing transcriptional regulator